MLTTKTVLLALLSATSGSAAAVDKSSPEDGSTTGCGGVDTDVEAIGSRFNDIGNNGVDTIDRNGVDGIGSNGVDGIGRNGIDGISSNAAGGIGKNGVDGIGKKGVDSIGSNAAAGNITCNQAAGNFNITLPQMYPEQADHDPTTCRTYFSILYDASVAVYDSNTKKVEQIRVPNKSGVQALHASGVQVNPKNQTLSIMLNAGAAFDTQGVNTSGENNLVVWDLKANKTKFIVNLATSAEKHHSGFQDMEHDAVGNIFVMSTFGGSLYRVGIDDQKVEKWWGSEPNASAPGLTGLAKFGEDNLVVVDASEKQLFRYNMKDEGRNQRTQVKLKETSLNLTELTPDLDGAYFPPKHDQKCLLVSDNTNGTIVVRSDDKWNTAEIRGIIPNDFNDPAPPEDKQGFTVATVQMGQRIFAIIEWFTDGERENGVALPGPREQFPLVDITDKVAGFCGEEGTPKGKPEATLKGLKPEETPKGKPEATPKGFKPEETPKGKPEATPKGFKPEETPKGKPEATLKGRPEVKPEAKAKANEGVKV